MTIRLATRRSPLALAQANRVAARLRDAGEDAVIVEVVTRGDQDRESELAAIAGQGVFAVEVQLALLEGRADVAVHSAKDLPGSTPEGLVIAAVPERLDPADLLVGASLASLGPGATIATGSPRRRALLLERRPDLNVIGLRGNMAARLAAVDRHDVDAVVAASAALERLGEHPLVVERLDPSWFVPQVGQGAIALEAREDDDRTRAVLSSLDDAAASRTLLCERAFLVELGAGCSVPAGAHARLVEGEVHLSAVMVAPDGSTSVRAEDRGPDPSILGAALARRLRDELGGGALWGTRAP